MSLAEDHSAPFQRSEVSAFRTEITARICREHGVSIGELFTRDHKRRGAMARHALWSAFRDRSPEVYSYPRLGKMFGYHHTTIMWGVRRHRAHVRAGGYQRDYRDSLTPGSRERFRNLDGAALAAAVEKSMGL